MVFTVWDQGCFSLGSGPGDGINMVEQLSPNFVSEIEYLSCNKDVVHVDDFVFQWTMQAY